MAFSSSKATALRQVPQVRVQTSSISAVGLAMGASFRLVSYLQIKKIDIEQLKRAAGESGRRTRTRFRSGEGKSATLAFSLRSTH